MKTENEIIEQIKEQRLLPLFYHADKNVCFEIARALYAAGVRIIEFTNRGENAIENFKALVAIKNNEMKELLLAVGTIRTAEQATKFIDVGADFLISPVFDNSVCDVAHKSKILWIPGCMSPTEIHKAEQAGCKLIKLFPGNVLGPSYVEAIKPLFPGLDFVATGGVDESEQNLRGWFSAGVCAVGLGSKLISNTILENKEFTTLEAKTRDVIATVRRIKK
jgi:2-dehydro-3-deoxyphosphogluconate aldolase/(4S)-4-hydroxy-2-oxoglutarate aldolase